MKDNNFVWYKVLGGLPKGTLVKVRDKKFTKGYYYGKIVYLEEWTSKKNKYYYCIDQYPNPHGANMWVRPESIIEVIEDAK